MSYLNGPDQLVSLFGILLQFQGQVDISADIAEMFYYVRIVK